MVSFISVVIKGETTNLVLPIRDTNRSSREQITHDFITTYRRRDPVYPGINSIQGAEDLITRDLSDLITNLQNTNQGERVHLSVIDEQVNKLAVLLETLRHQHLEMSLLLDDLKLPFDKNELSIFKGIGSPENHVRDFKSQMNILGVPPIRWMSIFPSSLGLNERKWFNSLEPNIVDTWDKIVQEFTRDYHEDENGYKTQICGLWYSDSSDDEDGKTPSNNKITLSDNECGRIDKGAAIPFDYNPKYNFLLGDEVSYLTRSGRPYQNTQSKGKEPKTLEIPTKLPTPNKEDTVDNVVEKQLQRIKADISIWELIKKSFMHREALFTALRKMTVSEETAPEETVCLIAKAWKPDAVTFSEAELPQYGTNINLAL